jgi:hypothetical protein
LTTRSFTYKTQTMSSYKEHDFYILDKYYELDSKGLYSGNTFWCQLAYRVDAPWQLLKPHVEYLLTLGPNLETFEEQYFNDYGHYYEDYQVNTYDEDKELCAVVLSDGEEDPDEDIEYTY